MTEFKVGDRVRVVKFPIPTKLIGQEGTVSTVYGNSSMQVSFDAGGSCPFRQDEVELAAINCAIYRADGTEFDSQTFNTKWDVMAWFAVYGIPEHHVQYHHDKYFYILPSEKVAELALGCIKNLEEEPELSDDEKIAVFMGMSRRPSSPTYYDFSPEYRPSGIHMVCHEDRTRFKTSWDWLMPVLEKIEDTFSTEILNSMAFIDGKHGCYIGIDDRFEGVSDSKIEAVYMSVVKYVTWYLDKENK